MLNRVLHLTASTRKRRAEAVPMSPEMREELLGTVPHLRAFAMSLARDSDWADDLVQETLLRALRHIHSFEPGTSLQGWVFRILRNTFLTQLRRRRREVEDPDGLIANRIAVPSAQDGHVDLMKIEAALAQLPLHQREALVLVAAQGFTYEETARICGTKAGTIKSRINRARLRLSELMDLQGLDDDVRSNQVLAAAPPPRPEQPSLRAMRSAR